MTISIIVAMTEDRVIGRGNKLPWHITEDLQRFKKITMGHSIIMGRKTFESIGKPLPGRQNIVVTRDATRKIDGVTVADSFDRALAVAGKNEVFVIGGAALFELALPRAERLYITLVHEKVAGDVFFPMIDLKRDYKIVDRWEYQSTSGDHLHFSFLIALPIR